MLETIDPGFARPERLHRIKYSEFRDFQFGIGQFGSRRCLDVDDELAGIGLRKEGSPSSGKSSKLQAKPMANMAMVQIGKASNRSTIQL